MGEARAGTGTQGHVCLLCARQMGRHGSTLLCAGACESRCSSRQFVVCCKLSCLLLLPTLSCCRRQQPDDQGGAVVAERAAVRGQHAGGNQGGGREDAAQVGGAAGALLQSEEHAPLASSLCWHALELLCRPPIVTAGPPAVCLLYARLSSDMQLCVLCACGCICRRCS